MTESISHVEQTVQARIAAARTRIQAAKKRRDELAAARHRGLAARHVNKLRNLAEAERRRLQAARDDGDDQYDEAGSAVVSRSAG